MKYAIVILYTRMPAYFLGCLRFFARNNPGCSIFCLCYRGSADAPFIYEKYDGVSIEYNEDINSDIENWVREKSPALLLVAGWSNKNYLKVSREYVHRIPVVLTMDNIWEGKWRQKVLTFFSKRVFSNYFNWIWVPGKQQAQYAKRLGFSNSKIRKGLYCCENIFNLSPAQLSKQRYANRNLLFVGRFVEYKRPQILARVFNELYREGSAYGWTLTLIGNGPLKYDLLEQQSRSNGRIDVIDFQQPEKLRDYFLKSSLFCLPSAGEHWGVVVHEAVSMGLPLLLSDTCGARFDLLENGQNGFVFRDSDESDFKEKLALLLAFDDDKLYEMGKESIEISKTISLKQWSSILHEMLNH